MKIVDIFAVENNEIALIEKSSTLKGIEVDTEYKKFSGKDAEDYLKEICNHGLKEIRDNGINARLKYDNIYLVTLNDYKHMNIDAIKPIVDSLKSKGIVFKNHKLKLQKDNKYANRTIIALTLSTILMLSSPFIIKQLVKKKELNNNGTVEVTAEEMSYSPSSSNAEEETTSSLYLIGTEYVPVESTTTENVEVNTTEPITEQNTKKESDKSSQSEDSEISLNSGNPTKNAVYKYLKTNTQFNDAAIAGIMGNIEQECGYDIESTYRESNGYTSHGLCQWNAERYENLKRFCGDDLYSVEAQLGFMMSELKNSYTSAYNSLLNVENNEYGARNAALIFAQRYEVCDSSSYNSRQNYAVEYYNQIKSSEYRLSNDDNINISVRR